MARRNSKLTTVASQPPPPVVQLLRDHKEALVILVNPDAEGESNLAVFSKLANKGGVLAAYLSTLLANLQRTLDHGPQPRHRSKSAAPAHS